MSANNTFLAVFLGSKTNLRMTAWNALPEAERLAKQKEGIAAWKAWAEKHQSAIVAMGGPLGKTKKVSQRGIEDTSNEMGAYMFVRAGLARGCGQTIRGTSALYDFSRGTRRDHARSADTGGLIGSSPS